MSPAGDTVGHREEAALPQAYSRAGGMIVQAAAGIASVVGFLVLTVGQAGVQV